MFRRARGTEAGMQYNATGGNGWLGIGCTLAGLPVITRDPPFGIKFDGADHFIYSGQRLVYTSSDGQFRHTLRNTETGGIDTEQPRIILGTNREGCDALLSLLRIFRVP